VLLALMIILGPVMVLVVVWCSCCVASLSLLAKISFFSLLRRSTELRANYFWILFLGIFVSCGGCQNSKVSS